MDGSRFDAIARTLAGGIGRRRVAAGLAATLLGGLTLPRQVAAACKNPGRPCDRDNDCCGAAECRGGECKCKSGRDECGNDCVKLDTDEQHCGRCNRHCDGGETCRDGSCVGPCGGSTCDATEECVGGVCTTPPGGCAPGADVCAGDTNVSCGGRACCQCHQSTEGATLCSSGVPIPGVYCGSCQSSADCAEFGEGAFCGRSTNTDICCGPSLQNACLSPCPA